MKFSIIVPVYNTEKYIAKCLNSILNQSYKNFEIIVVNDGSTDQSMDIINKYLLKTEKIILINQKNEGLSQARNNGMKKTTGEYVLFVDSDDYIEPDLLNKLNDNIEPNLDIVRFQIYTDTNYIKEQKENAFETTTGYNAFEKIVKYKYVELACCYCYKKSFYIKNNFSFKKGKCHEDFGLIPYIILIANTVKSISYLGYHYVKREYSIMNSNNYNNVVKKAFDFLELYEDLKEKTKDIAPEKKAVFLSFISNSAILKLKGLKAYDFDKYYTILIKRGAYDDILCDTLTRKLKKVLLKISIKLYLKVVK